jgi:ABC-type uncharacterized transport system involved in gliding motility auxiliary subunit
MSGLGSLFGGLGLVAVAFGLLSALLAVFQPVTDITLAVIVGNLVVGVLLLSGSLFVSFEKVRERLQSGEARRAGRYGGNALLSTALGIVVLGMLAYLSTRDSFSAQFDWSESQVNSLTQQSLDLLDRLEGDARIRAFFGRSEVPVVAALLDRYGRASDRLSVEFIEPNSNPGLIEELGLDPEALTLGLVRVELEGDGTVVSELGEANITNALLKLMRTGSKKVYFVSGHNERLLSNEEGGPAEGKESAGRAAEALRNETYEVEGLELAASGSVPEDADAVILAGPTRAYFDHEIDALRTYVQGGGGLLVMIDPRARTNLYDLLEEWGLVLADDVVVDQSLALFGQATSPFAGGYAPEHPITKDLRETTLYPMVRSVLIQGDAMDRWEMLVQTSADSWAERDLEGWSTTGRAVFGDGDLDGPVPVAVVGSPASDEAGGEGVGRVIVFGDSDWVTNEFLDTFRNKDLFLNSVNWLLGDIEQISVRPHTSRASRFQLDQAQFRRIQYLSLFVLPEAIAVLGVLAWWMRRDRSEG